MNAQEVAFKSGVLKPDVHMRLVQDIDHISRVAGIPKRMLWTPMQGVCSEKEIEWLVDFEYHKENGIAGLVLSGVFDKSPEDKMMLMTGMLLRNFIDARMLVVQDILDRLDSGTMPDPDALLVPNFFISKGDGGQLPSWKLNELLGLLIRRNSSNKITILYVQDLELLGAEYGSFMKSHITKHYSILVSSKKIR